jgi:hypothetical protein
MQAVAMQQLHAKRRCYETRGSESFKAEQCVVQARHRLQQQPTPFNTVVDA